jgi:transmembrane sensor
MNTHTHSEKIEDTAAQWAARLDGGGMTDEDQAALATWLAADPAHRRTFAGYREISARVSDHVDSHLATALDVVTATHAIRRRRRRVIGGTLLAAAAAVALVFSLRPPASRDLATHLAERYVTTLADHSRVELNAQTEITVHFLASERRVRFTRGEAFFNVAKDAARPFIIETPAGLVRVTGTEFNLRAASADEMEVTVLEGIVRVRAPGDATVETSVTPDHQAMVSAGRVSVRPLPAGEAQNAVAWRQGQVIFEDTPLRAAVERFAAYHARTIAVDPRAAVLRIGGRYSLADLDGWLESLEGVLPVRISHGRGGAVRIFAIEPAVP